MDSKTRKINNLKEHLRSIKSNIQILSKEISEKMEEKANLEKQIRNLHTLQISESKELSDIRESKLYELDTIRGEKESLQKEREQIEKDRELHVEKIKDIDILLQEKNSELNRLRDELSNTTLKIISRESEIDELDSKISNKKAIIRGLESIEKENNELQKKIESALNKLKELEEKYNKKELSLQNKLQKIEQEIDVKKDSVKYIKKGLELREKNIIKKERDLAILGNRYRQAYKKTFGIDTKII